MPVDYQQGRIYAIRAPSIDDVYIGSTCDTLCRRLANHRTAYRQWKAGKTNFVTAFNLLEREGYYIELVELFPCNSKEELNRREGEVIRATANCVNKIIVGRTRAEYLTDNREAIKEKEQQYRAANSEAIKEKKRQYGKAHRQTIRERERQYYETHKDAINERRRKYRETHKDAINGRNRQRYAAKKNEGI